MRVYDEDEAKRLNAKPWQLELLKANPEYVHWGPHEDYMGNKGEGWNGQVIKATWAEFGPWQLDELNECVNFYFSVQRASVNCIYCGGNGYHPIGQRIVNTFYAHMCDEIRAPRSEAWHDKITQDEVQALVDAGRLLDFTHEFTAGEGWKRKEPAVVPTAAEVNAMQSVRGCGFISHDAINRHILTEQRIKRVHGLEDPKCPHCEGRGYVYTEPEAYVSLTLWWLHPRKGCSRGIEVTRVAQADLPAIQKFLREAADRNAQRFSGINLIA